MYKTVTPKEAKNLLENGYRYLDVRTEREFAEGHAEGAVNIPIAGEGMVPNPDFVDVVEATVMNRCASAPGTQASANARYAMRSKLVLSSMATLL